MSVKNCIQNYDPKLVSQFEAMVESGLNEYEAAREIILSSHKTMFDELNAIKKDAGIKEEKYTDPQKTDVKPVKESAEIKKQKKKEEAQKKAEEKKAESEKQRKLREEKRAQEKKEKEEARKKEKEDKAEKKKKEQEEKKASNAKKSKDEMISILTKRHGISEKAAEKIVAAKRNLKEPRTLLDEIRKIVKIERRRQEELNIEQLPIDRVKRKNGAIGTQGVTTDQVASILKNVLGLTIPENATMKDLVNLFISDKANIDKLLEFTNLNPINITELPDGTIQINDGHHRAFLLDQAGITELPITRNNSEQINAKYDAELSALEKSTAQSTVTKVHGTSTGRDPGVVSPQDEDIAGVEDYQGILAATADIDGRQQKEMASSARRTVGEVRKEFEKNGNVVVSDAAMAALTGIKEVKGEGRSVNQNTYLFDILTDANASPDQRGVAAALILAHRVSAGNSFLANTFNAARKSETKGKKDGVVKIIYRPVDDASLITAHDDGSITINAYKLGRRVDEFGGENRFFSWAEMAMYEEVLHLSTFKVASTEEISQVGRELTQRERDVVESIYGSKLEKLNAETNKMEPDYYALGLEYIRMMTQTSMFGTSTELLKPLHTNERSAKKTFFAKLLRFLNDIFSLSRRERVATEVMDRLDTFLGRKDKDDQYKKPEQIIAESPKYSVFASPKGQKPVYMLTYKNRQYLLQEGRTASGPAWFEVQKMQDGFFAPVNDGSFIPGYLGTTYREAIQTLLARGGKGYGVSNIEDSKPDFKSGVAAKLSRVKMTPGRWSGGKSQEKAALYSKAGLLFHGGEAPIAQFDGEKIKGGSRSILGWGVYFSSSPYKASDYGTTFTYIDSTKLNILDGRGPVTQEFIDQIRKAANNEKDALTKAYYSIAADKFQQQIGKYNIDNARKIVSSQIQQNTDKAFSELLVKMGYDAMQEGYEFVVFNLSRTDAIVSDPDAHLESLYESGKMVDEIEGFIQDTSGYGVSKMEPQDDDDIDRLAREIFDDLMNEYNEDSGRPYWVPKVKQAKIEGDPIKGFEPVFSDIEVILQDFVLTEQKRGGVFTDEDLAAFERYRFLLKETEAAMLNIMEDIFAKYEFDQAISYIINTLKDKTVNEVAKQQLSKLVKQKLRFTHPDIVNYILERIEAGPGGLAFSASAPLLSRILQNVDETYVPDKKKPKKPKRDPKQVDMDRLFKDNEASEQVMYVLEQSEDGREMVKAMKEIQRRLEKNKALKDEEVLLVDMAAGSADNLSEIEQAARQANDLVNKMYKEVRKFKEEDKEAAEQRLRSTRYQMMARRKVDNMRDLAKQIKASIKQITERC